MGRHQRLDRVGRIRLTALRAAAALGVAGTITFAVQSVGHDVVTQAGSDSPLDSSADHEDPGTPAQHASDSGQSSSTQAHKPGMAVSFSSAPKVLTNVKDTSAHHSTPSHDASGTLATIAPEPGNPTPSSGTPSQTPDPGSTSTPSDQPTDSPSPSDDGSSHHSGGGLLGGVVSGIGGLL
jgi:hypothetical protein